MNNTIKHLDNGYFEVEQPSGEVVPVEVKKTCQCLNSKPIMKCSENGVSAYCDGCAKGFKEKSWFDSQVDEISKKEVSLGFDDDYSKYIDRVIDEFKSK